MKLLDFAVPLPFEPKGAPGLDWFRIGPRLFGFRGEIAGVRHCIVGDDLKQLGRLSRAIAAGDA